jgi:DNA-binding beta-propeller fold protein YncE
MELTRCVIAQANDVVTNDDARTLYVFNFASKSVSAIDPATNEVRRMSRQTDWFARFNQTV